MPQQEEKVFIKDPESAVTPEQRNKHLAAELTGAPLAQRTIVRIERIEISASGWYVYYRAGSAG